MLHRLKYDKYLSKIPHPLPFKILINLCFGFLSRIEIIAKKNLLNPSGLLVRNRTECRCRLELS